MRYITSIKGVIIMTQKDITEWPSYTHMQSHHPCPEVLHHFMSLHYLHKQQISNLRQAFSYISDSDASWILHRIIKTTYYVPCTMASTWHALSNLILPKTPTSECLYYFHLQLRKLKLRGIWDIPTIIQWVEAKTLQSLNSSSFSFLEAVQRIDIAERKYFWNSLISIELESHW